MRFSRAVKITSVICLMTAGLAIPAASQNLLQKSVTLYVHRQSLRQVLQDIHEDTGILFVYRDALVDGKTVYSETPEKTASHVAELIKAGADIIGGCCGTTPEHIRKMREVIDGLQEEERIAAKGKH